MSKAYRLEALQRYGIVASRLGCVMLDVDIPEQLSAVIPQELAYTSTNPDLWWVNGIQEKGHVTLKYGLLPNIVDIRGVTEVLEGWSPSTHYREDGSEMYKVVYVSGFTYFESPMENEPYDCIVATVYDDEVEEAHARLSYLPHIDTYTPYKAHVTLAYVKKGHASEIMANLYTELYENDHGSEMPTLKAGELNYGDQLS